MVMGGYLRKSVRFFNGLLRIFYKILEYIGLQHLSQFPLLISNPDQSLCTFLRQIQKTILIYNVYQMVFHES